MKLQFQARESHIPDQEIEAPSRRCRIRAAWPSAPRNSWLQRDRDRARRLVRDPCLASAASSPQTTASSYLGCRRRVMCLESLNIPDIKVVRMPVY
jgi:hypothetical protein